MAKSVDVTGFPYSAYICQTWTLNNHQEIFPSKNSAQNLRGMEIRKMLNTFFNLVVCLIEGLFYRVNHMWILSIYEVSII